MTFLRRLAFPASLAGARLRARGERVLLVGLGIAAGSAVLAAVLAGSLAAQDRSVERATARIPATDRAVRAVWLGVPEQGGARWPSIDRLARGTLRPLGDQAPVAAMIYRTTTIADDLVDLAGVDGIGRWVRLRSGRLPGACRPSRCEVVQLAGTGRIPSVRGIRLVRVGTAELTSPLPFGDFLSAATTGSIFAAAARYHQAAAPPFLVAGDVAGLAGLPELATIYRSYGWALPIAPGSVHPWSVDAFAAGVTRARSSLTSRSALFDLTAPVDELQSAERASRVGGRRLLLIGGEAAALLLAFTILAAASLRRDVDAAWRRLTWFGARPWQLMLFSGAESGAVALAATALGWAAGAGLAVAVAHRLGAPAGAVVAHSVGSRHGLAVAAGLAAASTLTLLAALRVRSLSVGGLAVSLVDVAAAGALAAIALALARGSADAQALAAGGGTGVMLLLLPGLVAFVAAVVAARALAPVLRLVERLGRRGPVPLRLAALSLARNPGHAAIAVTFLVVSLGLALFAETYRSTLLRGERDQAAFAVPADLALREDLTKLVPVSAVSAQLGRAVRSEPGAEVLPVLRLSGDVSRLPGSSGFTLLGVPADALPRLGGWRGDFSPVSRAELARRLAPAGSTALRGARLPAGARELALDASVRGDDLKVDATVLAPDGRFVRLGLGDTSGPLRAAIPAEARGGRLVSLAFGLTGTGLHGVPNGGANVEPVATGTLELGPLRADGLPVAVDFRRWIGTNGVRASGARLRYVVSSEVVSRFRPRQPTDGRPVPVVVSPRLAAAAGPGGLLPLEITGQRLEARIVGVASRFPSTGGDFALADGGTVGAALNTEVPGSAVPDEAWILAPDPGRLERELRRPPFDALQLTSRRAVEAGLRADPLARGSLLALGAAAVAALALALAGLLLGLVADLRDEAGELFDLEAQGAGPAELRRHLRLRTLALAGFGLLGGLVTGAVLSALVVDLVVLTAGAATPEPPLVLSVPWIVLAAALGGYALVAATLAALATRRMRVAA